LLDSTAPATLVFEDDATIPIDLVPRLRHILANLPPDWDILQLQRTQFASGPGCKPIPGDSPWELCTSLIGTHAYLVSRRGAKRLLEKAYPIELHVDAYMAYMARLEHVRMIWHPLINIPQRSASSNIDHGNGRICTVPTNMDDQDIVALSIHTIIGIMIMTGLAGGLLGISLSRLR
jgi:GR25 family glycosyltransferase involved in LPS biosynthesis